MAPPQIIRMRLGRRTTPNGDILKLTYVVLREFFLNLCINQIAVMWFAHPHFRPACLDAIKIRCKQGLEPLRIHLGDFCTITDTLLRNEILFLKGLKKTVTKLVIAGSVLQDDVLTIQDNRIKKILKLCPELTSLTLENVYGDAMDMELQKLEKLETLQLFSSNVNGIDEIHFPKLITFIANVLPFNDCGQCQNESFVRELYNNKFKTISHKHFIQFFINNPQLLRVRLEVIYLSTCTCYYQSNTLAILEQIIGQRNLDNFSIGVRGEGGLQLVRERPMS